MILSARRRDELERVRDKCIKSRPSVDAYSQPFVQPIDLNDLKRYTSCVCVCLLRD